MKYTYTKNYLAHKINGGVVIIPDQVATNQKHYDGKTFPVLYRSGGKARAMLMGDLYGLHTSGTGDPVVKII